LCLLSGILNIGGLEILLLSAPPPPSLDSLGGGDLPPALDRGGGDLPPALNSGGVDLPPALDIGGDDPLPSLDSGGSFDLPPEDDEQLLFKLLRHIGELCGSGASSLGYQAFSLLRLWCQRLQGGEHLRRFLSIIFCKI
jgi:hypothetical protein